MTRQYIYIDEYLIFRVYGTTRLYDESTGIHQRWKSIQNKQEGIVDIKQFESLKECPIRKDYQACFRLQIFISPTHFILIYTKSLDGIGIFAQYWEEKDFCNR